MKWDDSPLLRHQGQTRRLEHVDMAGRRGCQTAFLARVGRVRLCYRKHQQRASMCQSELDPVNGMGKTHLNSQTSCLDAAACSAKRYGGAMLRSEQDALLGPGGSGGADGGGGNSGEQEPGALGEASSRCGWLGQGSQVKTTLYGGWWQGSGVVGRSWMSDFCLLANAAENRASGC